jgi:hypothetical protein
MSHIGGGGGNAAALASATRSVMSSSSSRSSSSSTKQSSAGLLKDGVIDLTAGTLGGIANVYAGQVSIFGVSYCVFTEF